MIMTKKTTPKNTKGYEGKGKDKILFNTPKGMHDILPGEQLSWNKIRAAVQELAEFYNFQRIDTPILEYAELFTRGVGEDTDLVHKEMYLMKTKGGDVLALRPEGTTPVARAYLQHNLGRIAQPQKLFYEGQMFRYENPQQGRYREHHQAGFEIIGGQNDPVYDAQIIIVFDRLLTTLKIKESVIKMNSIGCRICRPLYRKQLVDYYKKHEKKLCEDCRRRLATNPLRLLDCKKENCVPFKEDAPNLLDKICASCSRHFKGVLEYLDELQISYELDSRLVRGFDYYCRTVFELYVADAEVGAVGGGGRYDYLVEMLGGRPTPGVGGAVGMERLVLAMKAENTVFSIRNNKRVFLVHIGDLAKRKSLAVVEELRKAGIPVMEAIGKNSLKSQMKVADKEKFPFALIIGQKEIYENSVIIRDLKSGVQETVPRERLVQEIKKRW